MIPSECIDGEIQNSTAVESVNTQSLLDPKLHAQQHTHTEVLD